METTKVERNLCSQMNLNRHGLKKVNIKVNMPFYFLEINEQTLGKANATSVSLSATRWVLVSRCESDTSESCVLFEQMKSLGRSNTRDFKSAMAALEKLVKVAKLGQPLESFYDKKQSHELHIFEYKGKKHVIWRIRNGDIRLTFYYGHERIIFLPGLIQKRTDKLTPAEKLGLESEVVAYLEAVEAQELKPVVCEVK